MSNLCWAETLTQTLKRLTQPDRPPRVAVIGMGHELCGDDAVGIIIARALHRLLGAAEAEHLLIIDAGPAPENHTGRLRPFDPDLVLLLDAAQMDESPGTVRWLDYRATTGLGGSTHTLPPHILARYLTAEIGCEVALLGIQPASMAMGETLSPVVQQVVEVTVQGLTNLLVEAGRYSSSAGVHAAALKSQTF